MLTCCSFSGMVYSDITWTSPVDVSTSANNASDPTVVIDSSGNATAIWVESDAILSSSLPFGGSWSSPVTLSNVLNTSSNPRLKIDSTGNVTALWLESGVIESATLPFGGSWGAETAVSASGASHPHLAVDGSDNAVAVWVRSGFIESSTRISGTWSLVSVLSAANSDNPHVAISDIGKAIAAWHSVISGSDSIVSSTLTVSSNTWGSNLNVFSITPSFKHNYPKVSLDANGNANVAWFRYNFLNGDSYQNVQVITSSLPVGASSWTLLPVFLSNFGIRNPADLTLKLRFDTTGDALAVWTNSYDGQTFVVESAAKPFGGSWPTQSVVPQAPSIYSFGFDVSMAGGTASLINMSWDGVSNIIITSQESDVPNPIVQGWTAPVTVSTGVDNGYPNCAMSLTGTTFNVVAVWVYFNGTNNVIQSAVGTDTMILAPSNVLATQSVTDFGVYQDYANTITWDASIDPNLSQYNIYRNGVYFGQTDPSTLQFVDHNQIQGETVVYGVAAFTTHFRQSEIVTFTLFP